LGRPVEPDVSITSGSGSSGRQPAAQASHDARVGPGTRRRKSMRRMAAPPAMPSVPAGDRATAAAAPLPVESSSWHPPPTGSPAPAPHPAAAVAPVLAGTGVAAYDDSAVWWKALLALLVSPGPAGRRQLRQRLLRRHPGTDDDRVGPMRLVGSGLASPRAVKTRRVRWRSASPGSPASCWRRRPPGGWCRSGWSASWPPGSTPAGRALRLPRARRGRWCSSSSGWSPCSARRTSRPRTWEWAALYAAVGSAPSPARSSWSTTCATSRPTPWPASGPWPSVLGAERTAVSTCCSCSRAAARWSRCASRRRGAPGGARLPARVAPGAPHGPRRAAGPALIPVLQQTGLAELVWAALVAAGAGRPALRPVPADVRWRTCGS
jgi:1,4-dihydroxy-2-naphthoate octaprenyltransferase